jgi:hypothetical protein
MHGLIEAGAIRRTLPDERANPPLTAQPAPQPGSRPSPNFP